MNKNKDRESKETISCSVKLGETVLTPFRFEDLEASLSFFQTAEYQGLNHHQKSEKVNRLLLELVLKAPNPVFLLPAVLEYISEIGYRNILINYTFSAFEIWLNQFSTLSEDLNQQVRGKIIGKQIPRNEYQRLFPIGMGKIYPGSHIVVAHASPDLDTTVASFWGWMDAFGARVSEGNHLWNLPGGAPISNIEIDLLFYEIFGKEVFRILARTHSTLALSSLELMTQRGVVHQCIDESSLMIDHERAQRAVILVDKQGYFLGDWRSFDVEGVRQVISMLHDVLRWFENTLHLRIVSLFAKKDLSSAEFFEAVDLLVSLSIKRSPSLGEASEKQMRHLDTYLKKILKMEKGIEETFLNFAQAMKERGFSDFSLSFERIQSLSSLFDRKGNFTDDRSKIFHCFAEIVEYLDKGISKIKLYTERLDVALEIKTQVFGYLPQVVSFQDDIEELRNKIGNYPYLTVTSSDEKGRMLPLGIVRARELQQPILATVSLRDFCNREETKIPPYFEIISVIDHHKSQFQNEAAAAITVSDAQSSNTLLAELAFALNDKYSTNGMSEKEIIAQIRIVQDRLAQDSIGEAADRRILQRLLQRLNAAQKNKIYGYFVDPLREFIEYLHFLYAILDDTDLLTKVSRRDVECVISLLHRLKSLSQKQEVEFIDFDSLKEDATYVEKGASEILRSPEMYSLYSKIYAAKERLIEENIKLCISGKESNIFIDTKLQNGCARIGQTKLFSNNFASFKTNAATLRQIWMGAALAFFEKRREVDFHLHMISTLAGAEDLFSGQEGNYLHQDELWIWIPMTELSIEHLKVFLFAFRSSSPIIELGAQFQIECIGPDAAVLAKIFKENFIAIPCLVKDEMFKSHPKESVAIIRFPAGIINSRKAMISPYLPQPIR